MAASSIVISDRIALGHTDYLYIGVFTPSTSYPTGGEPIDLTTSTGIAGPSRIKALIPVRAPGGPLVGFNAATQKLRMDTVAGTEVASTTDESAQTVAFIAVGP